MPDGGAHPFISAAVEGDADEAVVRRLIDHVGGRIGEIHGGKGKSYLRGRITGYDQAARHAPWIVLVDLDTERDCAVQLRDEWLPMPAANLCFRIVVREIEAWLMADAETLSDHMGIPLGRVPIAPEGLDDPKGAMVALARRSRRRDVREDMVPGDKSSRRVGPAYTGRLIEYAATEWRPAVAARRSESLRRAIDCLRRLVDRGADPGTAR